MPQEICPDRDALLDYLVGKLSDEESDALTEHLESCPICQGELATLSDADDTLIERLRDPATGDSVLDESACVEAVRRARGAGIPAEREDVSFIKQLGEYHLIERIGGGGMGTVYKALHRRLDRIVAVKFLPQGRSDDARAVGRFEREMKAIGRVDHQNIVRAYDAQEIDGRLVLVMEYVEGLDLAKIGRRLGRIGTADACELARQAAVALQVAHENGLVHRDVKPSNLMLTPEGTVKLLDLGLARFHYLEDSEHSPDDDEVTDTGQVMGTADYMAPEQFSDSRTTDIRADIYSLGATLYKLLTGRAPFAGPAHGGTLDKMIAHQREPAPPLDRYRADVPAGLAAVIERMMSKSPDDRYPTPAEVAEALAPWCAGSDLPSLLARANEAEAHPSAAQILADYHRTHTQKTLDKLDRMQGLSGVFVKLANLLILLLLVGGLGFWLGITIRIEKDGRETAVEVPEGSTARIDADGNVNVELPGGASKEPKIITSSEEKPSRFGPVVEQTVEFFGRNIGNGIDFDNQRLINGYMPSMYSVGSYRYSPDPAWLLNNNIGFYLYTGSDCDYQLQLNKVDGFRLARFSDEESKAWDCVSESRLLSKLRESDRYECSVLPDKLNHPETFAFQTKNDRLGMFQVVSYTENPHGAIIRYKLLQLPNKSKHNATTNPAAELKALLGQWKVVSVEKGNDADEAWGAICGFESPMKPANTVRIDLSQSLEGVALRLMRSKPEKVSSGWVPPGWTAIDGGYSFHIDPTTYPKTFDLLGQDGVSPHTRRAPDNCAAVGIYKLDGDLLTIRLARYLPSVISDQRPKTFSIEPDSADVMFTLARYTPHEDEKKINGDWTLTTWVHEGITIDNPQDTEFKVNDNTMIFHRSRYPLCNRSEWKVVGNTRSFALNPNVNPKQIVVYQNESTGKQPNWVLYSGIYKLDDDRLTIAYQKGDKPPNNFESPSGSKLILFEAFRPDKLKAVCNKEFEALQGEWEVERIESGKGAGEKWREVDNSDDFIQTISLQSHGFRSQLSVDILNEKQTSLFRLKSVNVLTRKIDVENGPEGFWGTNIPLDWSDNLKSEHVIYINPYATPKVIDLYESKDNSLELYANGIYQLYGERLRIRLHRDSWKIRGTSYMDDFTIESDSDDIILVLNRSECGEALQPFLGHWKASRLIDDGKLIDDKEVIRRADMYFRESYFSSQYFNVDGKYEPLNFSYWIIPSMIEKQILFHRASDKEDTNTGISYRVETTFAGIYKLIGDRLTIAYRKGDASPEKFESQPGSGVTLLELKRAEKKKE